DRRPRLAHGRRRRARLRRGCRRDRDRAQERARTPETRLRRRGFVFHRRELSQGRRGGHHGAEGAHRRDSRRRGGMKGVVAEDESLLREELVSQLAAAWPGLEIVACEDGGSALEAIADQQPQVAFLDIRMPGLTGLEVAAAAAEASPRTHVVFVTAYN